MATQDLKTTIERMNGEGYFDTLLSQPLSTWAPEYKPLLGETILPSVNVPNNKYEETGIRYRSPVANDGTRYSPAQKKGSAIVGKMDVNLTDQDIAADFTSEDYDNALAVLNVNGEATNTGNPEMMGVVAVTGWMGAFISRPLETKKEVMRWQAIQNAIVLLRGNNGYSKDIPLANPTGHRVNVGGTWSNNTYDPFDDIFAGMEFMAAKGYSIGRIITGRSVVFKMLNNAKVKAAIGGYINVDNGGALVGVSGRQTVAKLNDYLNQYNLPSIEVYDEQYLLDSTTPEDFTTTSRYYVDRDKLIMLATTGRDITIDRGDAEPVIHRNVLGYHGIGRPAGKSSPGIMMNSKYEGDKPPRFSSQAWQTTYPVPTDPEAMFVYGGIS
jgi:hypothetical protein